MFAVEDRSNYPVKVTVHKSCNHAWHLQDEKMAIFFDVLHGAKLASDPDLRRKLAFVDVTNDQGTYQGLAGFPLKPMTSRIIRCVHALLYGQYLPTPVMSSVHFPWPQADPSNGNRPFPHLMQTYQFAQQLCTAQRASTYDSLRAYNGQFRYVCTWTHSDQGIPMCLFAFDIYRLSRFAVRIADFPRAVIGFYSVPTPQGASRCSSLRLEHSDDEILYPLIAS